MQAIVTELVFEHSLRIRMKAETSDNVVSESATPTAVPTPDNASQADVEVGSGSGSDDNSNSGETDTGTATHSAESSTATAVASAKGKDKGKGKDADAESTTSKKEEPAKPAEEKKGAGKNLVGRINNLVSSDLNSLDWASMHIVFASAFLPSCHKPDQTELTYWIRQLSSLRSRSCCV